MNKVLIVDDSMFMRNVLGQIAEEVGLEAVFGADGEEAYEMFKKHKPKLTMLDITMPQVDGLTGLKLIREYDPSANVVMCSAMGNNQMVIAAIQGGARDFVVKPFNRERVVDIFRRV